MALPSQLLLKYRRLLTPECQEALENDPSAVKKLLKALEGGAELPAIIKTEDLERAGIHPGIQQEAGEEPHEARIEDTPTEGPAEAGSPPGDDMPLQMAVSSSVNTTIRAASTSRGAGSELRDDLGRKTRTGPGGMPRPPASEYDGSLELIFDPVKHMGSRGKIEDFKRLFQDRYSTLREILRANHGDLMPTEDIGSLVSTEDQVRVVGMVMEARSTKNGHTMLELEDLTGTIRVLLHNRKEVYSVKVVEDEVVGIVGKYKPGDRGSGGIIFADSVFKAEISPRHRRRLSGTKELMAAFTSDIHIGSKMFLPKEWNRMVRWLRMEADSSLKAELGGRVKYLILAGDLVDGIGIYPDQERDLQEKDIYKQYEMLAEALSGIPSHVEVILMPGNHDAVRLAEPQPALPKEIQDVFYNDRIHFLTNPAFFSLDGVHVTAYHGKSLDDLVTEFKDVTYENPLEGMKEMIRSRHLSPTFGMRNQVAPEDMDMLVIRDVPDIFVSGHVHRFGIEKYQGVQMIQGSTWQSQTPFQKMMNLKPQPARMGIVELDTPHPILQWGLETT